MSMNVVFTKTKWTAAQEALRYAIASNSIKNYDMAVEAAAQGTKDPAGVAVIAYSIDVSFPPLYFFDSFYLFSFIFMCLSSDW